MKVPKNKQITASMTQNRRGLAPIEVKNSIIFWGVCVYVNTTLKNVAVAIIEKITAVVIAVSFKHKTRPVKVNSR